MSQKVTKTELKRHLMQGNNVYLINKDEEKETLDTLLFSQSKFYYINGHDGTPQELPFNLIFETYKEKESAK